jgi:hypothetical protein
MKNWKQSVFFGLVAIIALCFGFIGCEDKSEVEVIDYPKDQSQIITLTFETESPTATVKGHLTNTQWNGVADKIKNALNARFAYYVSMDYDGLIDDWKKVFNQSVIIIVEKSPSGYAKWKTTTDGKTLFLAFGELDNGLQETVGWGIGKMSNNTADNG